MAYIVMAYIEMTYVIMAYRIMAFIVMTYIVMGYVVIGYVVMAYVVMRPVFPSALHRQHISKCSWGKQDIRLCVDLSFPMCTDTCMDRCIAMSMHLS